MIERNFNAPLTGDPDGVRQGTADDIRLRPSDHRQRGPSWLAVLVLIISAALIFWNLGHYALWDDEALTALLGQSVWETGDTSIVRGHNVIGYQGGVLTRNGFDRYQPPLQFYLVAPFVGWIGPTPLAARLPFALCGWLCVAILVRWVERDAEDRVTRGLFYAGIVTSVAMMLFFRQARYYAPAILLSVVIAYLYLHWQGRRRTVVAMAVALVLLLLTNYMNYAALCACLGADYLVNRRRTRRLQLGDWAMLIVPQVVVGALLLAFRNPTGSDMLSPHQAINTPFERLLLLVYSVRDLSTHEFIPLLVLLAAPVIALVRRDVRVLRALVALAVYVLVVAAVAPSATARTGQSEVRYLCPLLPLCLALQVAVVRTVWRAHWVAGALAAVLVFGTTLPNVPVPAGPAYAERVPARSTIASFVQELLSPPPDPYTAAAAWVAANVAEGQSILVWPSYAAYPMMFLQPKAVYAWQFANAGSPRLPQGLPDIHFESRIPPDYVILFTRPDRERGAQVAQLFAQHRYELATMLDLFGRDVFRPEIGWRSFSELKGFDPASQGVYIYRKAGN